MKAPTEKHLEDWIALHLNAVLPIGSILLRRQLRLPSGIADMVAVNGRYLTVIELKKGVVDAACVVQALRYMCDLQGIYEQTLGDLFGDSSLTWDEFNRGNQFLNFCIQGVVIGSSFEDKHMPVICEAANISLMTYEHDVPSDYSFIVHASPGYKTRTKDYETYFDGDLIAAIKDLIFKQVSRD